MTACNLMRYRMFCWSPRRRSRKKSTRFVANRTVSQPSGSQSQGNFRVKQSAHTHTHISCSRAMCERAHLSSPTQRAPSIHANRHTGLSHTQTRTRSQSYRSFVWLQFVCLCLCVLFMCFQVTIFRDNLEAPLNSHTHMNIHAHSETVAKGITFHTFVMKKH